MGVRFYLLVMCNFPACAFALHTVSRLVERSGGVIPHYPRKPGNIGKAHKCTCVWERESEKTQWQQGFVVMLRNSKGCSQAELCLPVITEV